MTNQPFHILSADLRESDPLCRYVTIERSYLDLLLVQSAERTSQLASADCEELKRIPGARCVGKSEPATENR